MTLLIICTIFSAYSFLQTGSFSIILSREQSSWSVEQTSSITVIVNPEHILKFKQFLFCILWALILYLSPVFQKEEIHYQGCECFQGPKHLDVAQHIQSTHSQFDICYSSCVCLKDLEMSKPKWLSTIFLLQTFWGFLP